MWSMYDNVETAIQFCLQKPNVHNSTLLIQGPCKYLYANRLVREIALSSKTLILI